MRSELRAIFLAGIRAVEPRMLVRKALAAEAGGAWRIVAAGKASLAMLKGARDSLGRQPVWAHYPAGPGRAPGQACPHPLAGPRTPPGVTRMREFIRALEPGERMLYLISGGASAMLALPAPGISLRAWNRASELALRSGATIAEINTLRKHLSEPHPLVPRSWPRGSRGLALLLSDVRGDLPAVIGSGPVSPDASTFADAIEVARRHGFWTRLPKEAQTHLLAGKRGRRPETLKPGAGEFSKFKVRIVGSNAMAREACVRTAWRMGLPAWDLGELLYGTPEASADRLARALKHPGVYVAGGETSPEVRGSRGVGGRNQELALALALRLGSAGRWLALCAGTDGADGSTGAAGAFAGSGTLERASARGLDARRALKRHDSGTFFAELGARYVSGPTGTNVMDLAIVVAV